MASLMRSTEIEAQIPTWAPKGVSTYLAHSEGGRPLRALAREAGVHASTILRQVRAVETRREDVLVDRLLCRLGRQVQGPPADDDVLSADDLTEKARPVLARLCEAGAVMAVATDMDKAVIVREVEGGDPTRRGVVDRDVAEALAVKGWVSCAAPARVSRYRITQKGRKALGRMMARAENQAAAWADMPSQPFVDRSEHDRAPRITRQMETPLALLARRRDKAGALFLSPELVSAGERLREDFELGGMRTKADTPWDQYLTDAEDAKTSSDAAKRAKGRVVGALRDLGPGLGDAALRCCCLLEGLEITEQQMGWSARSGKIVLRIALQRVRRFYDRLGEAGALLG